MSIRADNTSPGAQDRSQNFRLDRVFRFGSDSAINRNSTVDSVFPPNLQIFVYQNDNIIIAQNGDVLQPQSA